VTLAEPAAAQSVGEKTRCEIGARHHTRDNGLRHGGRGKRHVRDPPSKRAVAKTNGGVQFSPINWWATHEDNRARASRLTRGHADSTGYVECATKHDAKASRDDRTRIPEADDRVSAHKDAASLFERYGKGGDNAALRF
jgi:hypothetical protein